MPPASRAQPAEPVLAGRRLRKGQAHRIVFANEKGGTGKSTTAVHVAVALSYLGARVASIDLDPRQRTMHRYIENRLTTLERRGLTLPTPDCEVFRGNNTGELLGMIRRLEASCDFLIIDNPGRDDPYARIAVEQADTLVTPMNDSFVDFDLIGQVDAETFKVRRLSFYAELIWETRKKRALERRQEIDWVVVRNRTGHVEARNMLRIDTALTELSNEELRDLVALRKEQRREALVTQVTYIAPVDEAEAPEQDGVGTGLGGPSGRRR